MPKSYFAILGVSSGASAEEIRSAYRRLAKTYHPDHSSGDSEPFRQVQEAYSVLSDERRRHDYEQAIDRAVKPRPVRRPPSASHSAPEPLIPESRPADLGDISPVTSFHTFSPSFDEIFDRLWQGFGDRGHLKSGRLQHLTLEVPLTRQQARAGGTARVLVPARTVCPTCRGYGSVGPFMCVRCGGEGYVSGEIPVSVDFPAGLAADHAVVIPLQRFGIDDLRLTVLFRPTDADRF